jgi:flotillin
MFDDTNLITTLAIVALVIAFFAVVIFISKRIRRVPPNEALVIVGRGAGRKEATGS